MLRSTEIYKIDENGFIIENYPIDYPDAVGENYISTPLPQPNFHRPKWNGEEWVEGKTQAEIDADDLLESLKPKPEEIANAEFELKTLNILMEVGLI